MGSETAFPKRLGPLVRLVELLVILAAAAFILMLLRRAVESGPPSRRTQCLNNIRNIGMALFSYAMDNQNRLPTAYIADKEGRPIHSWRTSLLGYMDDFALASKYRWSEPWNGPHNSKLAERPLGFLHCPDDSAPPTETSYMVVVGPRTAFPGSNSRSLEEIEKGDGTSNTILSVEVRESGVNWMQPRDVKFEDAIRGINPRGVLGISSSHEGVVMVCFADGHAVPISVDTSPQVLKQLLQIDDGGPSKFP